VNCASWARTSCIQDSRIVTTETGATFRMMQSVITSSMGQEFLILPQTRSGHSGVGLESTVRGVSSPWFTMREAAVLANMHAHPVMHKVPGRAIGPNKGFCSLRSIQARWAYEAGLCAVSYRGSRRPVHIQKQILSSLYTGLGRSRQWLCSSPGQAAPPCGTFAVATLAQEGHSSLEGVTEEELLLPDQQAEAPSPLEEDTPGPVIIRVRGKASTLWRCWLCPACCPKLHLVSDSRPLSRLRVRIPCRRS
jgi:hypothetical protein